MTNEKIVRTVSLARCRISVSQSGASAIRIYEHETADTKPHPALMVLHGSGGAVSYWVDRFAPTLARLGVATYAPHYFDKTGTQRATAETILDGKHFAQWLEAIRDGFSYIADRPSVDAKRIAVLGISLGGYLAVALGAEDTRVRAVIEMSGGIAPEWEHRVTSAMHPVLIVHGMQDNVVPVSEAHKLEAVLKRHNVPYQMELLPGETHWFSAAAQPRILMACAGFLGRHL
jgi:carboxymethylenebutenolidase